jgi:hypothetical protein
LVLVVIGWYWLVLVLGKRLKVGSSEAWVGGWVWGAYGFLFENDHKYNFVIEDFIQLIAKVLRDKCLQWFNLKFLQNCMYRLLNLIQLKKHPAVPSFPQHLLKIVD